MEAEWGWPGPEASGVEASPPSSAIHSGDCIGVFLEGKLILGNSGEKLSQFGQGSSKAWSIPMEGATLGDGSRDGCLRQCFAEHLPRTNQPHETAVINRALGFSQRRRIRPAG